ncbi:ATP-binding protein [Streptosporangium sp. NBC_01495]|uniref:ATP-binding protein n=1 Tax=Streptosporangium sp. NBC_01495 TaxID=2903899 RepID=UPI002E34CAE6|nr:ATP-binding protein [Streptosporangium sp. NBC_01495]
MTLHAQLKMTVDPLTPKRARVFTTDILRAWGERDLVDDAVLIVSELVTNAFRHGRSRTPEELTGLTGQNTETVTLLLELWPNAVGIHLQDGSSVLPVPRVALDDQENGRGLQIVTALAQSWTAAPVAANGKRITTFLRRDSTPSA